MGNFLNNLRMRMRRFMQGRYGSDPFGRFLLGAAIAFLILSFFFGKIMYIIALVLMIYAYFRIFSKKPQKRYRENLLYMGCTKHIRSFFSMQGQRFAQRKTHRIYRCPKCGQHIRVPKGKGKIRITCPKCRNEFIKVS